MPRFSSYQSNRNDKTALSLVLHLLRYAFKCVCAHVCVYLSLCAARAQHTLDFSAAWWTQYVCAARTTVTERCEIASPDPGAPGVSGLRGAFGHQQGNVNVHGAVQGVKENQTPPAAPHSSRYQHTHPDMVYRFAQVERNAVVKLITFLCFNFEMFAALVGTSP